MSESNNSDKREQILIAAEQLIAESGFHGLSMQRVADKASVAAGTIYRYFSDKQHLLDEVRLHITQRIASAVQEGVDDEMPLKERYKTMWLNIWNLAISDIKTLSGCAQFQSLPSNNPEVAREIERQMFAQVDLLFNQGKDQGIFKPLDNCILIGLSIETSVPLATRHAIGLYPLDDQMRNAAIDASWDAIIKH